MDGGRVEAERANCSTIRLWHGQLVLGGGFSLGSVSMVWEGRIGNHFTSLISCEAEREWNLHAQMARDLHSVLRVLQLVWSCFIASLPSTL